MFMCIYNTQEEKEVQGFFVFLLLFVQHPHIHVVINSEVLLWVWSMQTSLCFHSRAHCHQPSPTDLQVTRMSALMHLSRATLPTSHWAKRSFREQDSKVLPSFKCCGPCCFQWSMTCERSRDSSPAKKWWQKEIQSHNISAWSVR